MTQSTVTKAIQMASIFGAGLIGTLLAIWAGLPIPFLLGSLAASASVSLATYARTGQRLWFPLRLRHIFIGVIGTMIGTTFTTDFLSSASDLLYSLAAMVVFVIIVQIVNFTIFHRIGGLDRVTATYAAIPGGLVESIALGEKAGGDSEAISLQHFVRIVLTICSIPLLFQFVTGQTVGSAAGEPLQIAPPAMNDLLLFVILVPGGVVFGKLIRLPAHHLLGPMFLTAILQTIGVIDLTGSTILSNLAQFVVGCALGSNFARSTPAHLLSAFALGALSVAASLTLASGFAWVLEPWVPMSFDALLVSFAPGGVTEMSLVALSLGVAPVLVSIHHMFRIIFTVTVAGLLTKTPPQEKAEDTQSPDEE